MVKSSLELSHVNWSSVDPGFTVDSTICAKCAVVLFLMVVGLAKLVS